MLKNGLRPKFMTGLGFVLCVSWVLAMSHARAAEKFPRLAGAVAIEIQNDWTYQSDDSDSEHNQLYAKIEPEAAFHFMPGLHAFAHAVLEPVKDPDPGESRAFEDEGLYLEDLFLRYETDGFALQAGKFTPAFGLAWDIAPGIYGTDLASAGYEFSERVGIFASAVLIDGKNTGAHGLSAHAFFLDTSVLGQSVGAGRGTTGKSDGGVSNTEDLSSYAVTLDGEDVAGIGGLAYRLSYIRQAPGVGNETDETGYSAGITYRIDLGNGVSVTPFLEYVHFDDSEGVRGQDRDFLTLSGEADWHDWTLSLSYTERDTEMAGVKTDDFQFQASVGYLFEFGIIMNVGWFIDNVNGIETQKIGFLLVYGLDF